MRSLTAMFLHKTNVVPEEGCKTERQTKRNLTTTTTRHTTTTNNNNNNSMKKKKINDIRVRTKKLNLRKYLLEGTTRVVRYQSQTMNCYCPSVEESKDEVHSTPSSTNSNTSRNSNNSIEACAGDNECWETSSFEALWEEETPINDEYLPSLTTCNTFSAEATTSTTARRRNDYGMMKRNNHNVYDYNYQSKIRKDATPKHRNESETQRRSLQLLRRKKRQRQQNGGRISTTSSRSTARNDNVNPLLHHDRIFLVLQSNTKISNVPSNQIMFTVIEEEQEEEENENENLTNQDEGTLECVLWSSLESPPLPQLDEAHENTFTPRNTTTTSSSSANSSNSNISTTTRTTIKMAPTTMETMVPVVNNTSRALPVVIVKARPRRIGLSVDC